MTARASQRAKLLFREPIGTNADNARIATFARRENSRRGNSRREMTLAAATSPRDVALPATRRPRREEC